VGIKADLERPADSPAVLVFCGSATGAAAPSPPWHTYFDLDGLAAGTGPGEAGGRLPERAGQPRGASAGGAQDAAVLEEVH
jgi:hypothetical protein